MTCVAETRYINWGVKFNGFSRDALLSFGGRRRSKKIKLIEATNPKWEDLARDWGNKYRPAAADQREIPRPAGENAGLRDDAA